MLSLVATLSPQIVLSIGAIGGFAVGIFVAGLFVASSRRKRPKGDS
jgi:hypothetical protein